MKIRISLSLPIVLGTLALGCGVGGDGTTGTGAGASGGSGATGSSVGGTSNGGAGGTASSMGGGFNTVNTVATVGNVGGGACVAQSVETEQVPLDIIVLLDESGSMTGTKWDTATNALKTFVNDPLSAGISVGIEFFPTEVGDDCDVQSYQQLDVQVAELPGNAAALTAAIDLEDPQGGTPTWAALKGVLGAATARQDLFPDRKVIVVFASDGDPSSCGPNTGIPEISMLASSARNYNGVQTYVIAMQGATIANLNAIAVAGGTGAAYDVSGNVTLFTQKMQEIRSKALSCEFPIPEPPMGEMLDPNKVNVQYTPMGMGMPTDIPRADNLQDCGSTAGWYYDSPQDPTKITLCPASCTTIQADSLAKVDVAFGCGTIPN
jgi:Mg-chelatase subunit ChlD